VVAIAPMAASEWIAVYTIRSDGTLRGMRLHEVVTRCWLAAAVTCLATPVAAADRITLTNGDVLTGQIRSGSDTALSFEGDLVGRVSIKWTAVSQMTPTTSVRTTLRNEQTVEGTLAVSDGRVSIRQADGTTMAVAVGDIRSLDLSSTSAGAASWHSSLNADLARSRGNSETSNASVYGRATRVGRRDKLGLFGTHLFSAIGSGADGTTTARSTRGGARYDHDAIGPLYGFGFGDVENDPLQLLDLRLVVGGGAGLHLLKRSTTQFNIFGGISYARDAYVEQITETPTTPIVTTPTTGPPVTPPGKGGTPPGLSGIRPSRGGTPPAVVRTSLSRSVSEFVAGQDLWRQLSNTLSLSESLTVFPAVGDLPDYRVSFDLSLSAQLNDWLQWNVSLGDRYLHIPPAGGAVQNDTYISSGLGITLGSGNVGGFGGADRPDPRQERR
jgi:hypothetical protein